MDIHEHQAKELFKLYNIPTPEGKAVFSVEDATKAANDLPGPVYVVKAQIHAGGRGKAGGVKVVKDLDAVKTAAQSILGKKLITPQTGSGGKLVNRLYIEDGCDIKSEFYFSMVIDRVSSRISVIASTEGGMDIEKVADETPEKILSFTIDPTIGFQPFHSRLIANSLELTGSSFKQAGNFFAQLYKLFTEKNASLLEINPLVLTSENTLIALDAKMSFDNNALFRHKNILDLRDESEEDPSEIIASKFDLAYIKLDGTIGCLVNGAGLAMATMDIIKLKGGSPANFLDVGGSATEEKVTEAFKIILSDAAVEGILVNIFGGIMRCDIIAAGVVKAAKALSLSKPLVVRLAGTNVDEGKKILSDSGLKIIPADDLDDAAVKIVNAVKEIN
ncbi:ADP-forming succinate--CoA ligase subunit beta [Alphaproteobacteria bacterium]|uniref:ADP-forming succinate--CoA ligase subunit beta n=1 Tax=Candidatus Levibacter sp. Uisw_134_01 TaxID=3230999 RepID=UPI0023378D98|nr:ADP-forming succinate--CoA ligase subunit beta [Alphaproteobacteria bacterium]